jgi:hypothetical protein
MWEALNNSTSSFVVASFQDASSVQQRERSLLESACKNGDSRGLVLKFPKEQNRFDR